MSYRRTLTGTRGMIATEHDLPLKRECVFSMLEAMRLTPQWPPHSLREC